MLIERKTPRQPLPILEERINESPGMYTIIPKATTSAAWVLLLHAIQIIEIMHARSCHQCAICPNAKTLLRPLT
jgi:hypothetical protein